MSEQQVNKVFAFQSLVLCSDDWIQGRLNELFLVAIDDVFLQLNNLHPWFPLNEFLSFLIPTTLYFEI